MVGINDRLGRFCLIRQEVGRPGGLLIKAVMWLVFFFRKNRLIAYPYKWEKKKEKKDKRNLVGDFATCLVKGNKEVYSKGRMKLEKMAQYLESKIDGTIIRGKRKELTIWCSRPQEPKKWTCHQQKWGSWKKKLTSG